MSESPTGPGSSEEAVAVFGGGCFWCVEAVFRRLKGVVSVESGYCGGTTAAPTYEEVCTGRSGHAEVVRVRFDPALVPYVRLLEVFFATHDPTTQDRQGADVGSQYRSVIFAQDDVQRREANDAIARLDASGVYDRPVVTQVVDAAPVVPAEPYHQDYWARNPGQPYCEATIPAKIEKLRRLFASDLR